MDNVLMPSENLELFQEIGHEVWSLVSIPIVLFFKNLIYKLYAGTAIYNIVKLKFIPCGLTV